MQRFQSFLTPWLWPKKRSEQPNIVIRLGRVIHWCFIVSAILSVIIGVALTAITYQNHEASVLDIAAWKKAHTSDVCYSNPIDIELLNRGINPDTSKPLSKMEMELHRRGINCFNKNDVTNEQSQSLDVQQIPTEEPTAVDAEPMIALGGVLTAFIFLLVGRAVRYVLAAE